MSRQHRGEQDHVSRCDLGDRDRDRYGSGRHYRSTAASTSAHTNNPERSNGRAAHQEGRDDLQLVNLSVPPKSTLVVSKLIRASSILGSNETMKRLRLHDEDTRELCT